MNIYHPPQWLRKLYPSMIWNIADGEKVIYLTFDDGPTPEVTDWVLDLLDEYNAKATFFCIGRNVDRYPDIFNRVVEKEHAVGNHTYSHLNGWRSSTQEYVDDVQLAAQHVQTKLFRPAYGRIKSSQIKALKALGFTMYLWDVLSEDYSRRNTPEKCLGYVNKYTSAGSIIVFHDSEKAKQNLYGCLPEVLKIYSQQGYVFKSLPE